MALALAEERPAKAKGEREENALCLGEREEEKGKTGRKKERILKKPGKERNGSRTIISFLKTIKNNWEIN